MSDLLLVIGVGLGSVAFFVLWAVIVRALSEMFRKRRLNAVRRTIRGAVSGTAWESFELDIVDNEEIRLWSDASEETIRFMVGSSATPSGCALGVLLGPIWLVIAAKTELVLRVEVDNKLRESHTLELEPFMTRADVEELSSVVARVAAK